MDIKALTQPQYTALITQLTQSGPITNNTYLELGKNFARRWQLALYLVDAGLPVPDGLHDSRIRELLTEKGYQAGFVNQAGITAWAKGEGRGFRRAQEPQTGKPALTHLAAKSPVSETKKRKRQKFTPSTDLAVAVGQLLAQTRELKGMTQADLAMLAGDSNRHHVCKIEKGATNLTLRTMERMFAALGKRVSIKLENI